MGESDSKLVIYAAYFLVGLATFIVARMLDQLGLPNSLMKRW